MGHAVILAGTKLLPLNKSPETHPPLANDGAWMSLCEGGASQVGAQLRDGVMVVRLDFKPYYKV
jgi:hypothetical protein